MTIEKEREAFSRWVLTHPDNLDLTAYEENIMFDAWLASANRDGYKLVPVEPTERMLDSAYSSISDNLHYADLENIYTAMIGACDDH